MGSLVALDCMLLAYGMSVWGLSAPVMILIVLAVGLCVRPGCRGSAWAIWEIQPFIVTMGRDCSSPGHGLRYLHGAAGHHRCVNETFYNMSSFRISLPFGGTVNRAGKVILPYIGIGVVIAPGGAGGLYS